MSYIAPSVLEKKFTCPHCGVLAMQRWVMRNSSLSSQSDLTQHNQIRVSACDQCGERALWLLDSMLYPDNGGCPPPNPDLPQNVSLVYREAAGIAQKSPRGAAALLRLGLQILCRELGESGEHINTDIAALVKKGLPERVQQALDIVRVTGNNAVHPGQIDVDDPHVVSHLFLLINVIAEYCISMPSRISSLYDGLPSSAREQVTKRDKKA